MDRRTFIGTLTGGLLAAPLAAEGQPAAKVYRIGLLGHFSLTSPEASQVWEGFFQGLWELGYVEGRRSCAPGDRVAEGAYHQFVV